MALTTGASDQGQARRRRPVILIVRLVVSIGLMAFLLSRVPRDGIEDTWPGWSVHTLVWVGGAFLLVLASVVVSTLRWQRVLHALGLPSRLRRLLSHYLAGLFVGNVLPTTIGGDVLRVSRLAKDNGHTPNTFASVVLERLTGWLVLPLITFAGFAVNPGLRRLGAASAVAFALALGTMGMLIVLLWLAAHPRVGGRIAHHTGWRRFVGAVHLGLVRFRDHPGDAVGLLLVGLCYQAVLIAATSMAAEALGIDVSPTALLVFVPAVAIAQVLPVGIAGLGLREGALVMFLRPLGVATEQAIALGLLLYAINILVSLFGAPAFAVGPRAAGEHEAMV